MHVAEKLLQLDRRTRTIAEKRINDIFFDIEMNGRNSFQSSGPLMHPISPDTSESPLIQECYVWPQLIRSKGGLN